MCINPTGGDGDLDTCEALVAKQKLEIQQLEEDLQHQKELCVNLRAQLKAVENTDDSVSAIECELTDNRIALITSLEKDREIYRILIKNYPNGLILLFDQDLRYTVADGQGLAVLGLSKEQLEGKTLWEIAPPEDLQSLESKYRGALAGKEYNFEYKYTNRIYFTTIVPVRNDLEAIIAGMVVIQDITEQKQTEIALQLIKNDLKIKYEKRSADLKTANQQLREEIIDRWRTEEALRESQQQLELFFSQSLDGFFFVMLEESVQWENTVDQEQVLDCIFANGRITKANDALIAQYGATRQEFIGLTLNILSSHNLAGGRDVVRKLFEAGRIHIECDNHKFDGTTIWVEGNYICIYDSRGRIVGYFGVQRDISGRKKAEAALKESEERFRQLAENIESVFWTIDFKEDKLIYISPAYEKIWDRTRADLYAFRQSFTDFVHPEDSDEVRAAFSRLIVCENGNDNDNAIEYRIVRPDGEIRWIRDRAFPIRNSTGEIYRIVGIAEDISDRKRVQKELQDAKQMYQQILDAITDIILVKGPESRIVWANKAFRDYYQRENSELIGIIDAEFQEPEYTQQDLLDDARVFNTGEVGQILEEPLKNSYGEVNYFDTIKSPIFDTEGKVVMTVGVSRNTTERKQAQKALRESEERFRQLAENIQDSFWLVAVELTDILYVSPAYEQIWGRSREDLYAHNYNWIDWVHPEDQNLLHQSFGRIVAGESTSTEYRVLRPDGTICWVCDRAFPIYNESGILYRVAGICEDISDRKFAESRLQGTLREKEVLLKEIHHRVKNNMQVISSLLELQAQYIDDEATLFLFEESQSRIHSMALIHEQLYQSDNLARIDIQNYVENLVANLFQSFGLYNDSIQINLNIEPIYLNIETAIPCGLIINELVSNSLKYAFIPTRKGEITINFLELVDTEFNLSIQDNGRGFPPGFDVENTETLGLRLVKMLAQQLDGEITIESKCGICYNILFKELNYRRRI
ncbi:MAG: PAS domain S-box protein [Oscillatoriales cyanobacterium]|uniref:histidine kinase n=1 Tax=Microcoleus anatoxicus PTRS2 TaxID=2705321 RepID=A0ABU8YLL8_9CYAN|nr:MAG: PAS domain S-box protein [Oscillatoriales cyanobacterium]TAD99464.1 MAG: PAS domain S-box protein [Oscillatoriales cyanobacterium]TAF04289.1 MAG: PAS domain S-box protein [Oscillatoriales cyanobacterium]TAF34897.1 MAG: PAS domain S-box protein [Oscillatoriales cyanobacterium]TAF70745.1 MAG: PAS domain S-box protein [Oscillatoriales cyanobacterium]